MRRLLPLLALAGCEVAPERPAEVQANANGPTFTIGQVERVAGTPFLALSVTAGGDRGAEYSSGSSAEHRNVVLLYTPSGRSRRLMPDNGRKIRAVHWLSPDDRSGRNPDAEPDRTRAPVRWYVLEVERTGEDTVDLIAGAVEGGEPKTIAQAIDGVDFLAMRDPTQAELVVRQQRRLSYRIVDLSVLRQTAATPVAID